MVRYYLPLQQGLRQSTTLRGDVLLLAVRYYLPLQQGLRPTALIKSVVFIVVSQILSSTTTRIKTVLPSKVFEAKMCQILSSTTTRIKTEKRFCTFCQLKPSDTIFHYNKD